MKGLNKREKYLVIFLGAAIIAFIYLQYFLLPVLDNINIARKDIDSYNSQLSQLNIIGITNKKLKGELAKVQLSYNDALLKLPPLERNPEIAHNIKPFADSDNVTLDSVTFSDGALYTAKSNTTQNNNTQINNSNLYNTTVGINMSANNYSDVMNFVNSLETDKRMNEISSFSMQYKKSENASQTNSNSGATVSGQVSTNVPIISASISISYFYKLDNNAKPNYSFNKRSYGKNDIFK